MQRHTMTEVVNHSRSTALERSVKILLGVGWVGGEGGEGGLNRFYLATPLAPSFALVYTSFFLGFLSARLGTWVTNFCAA